MTLASILPSTILRALADDADRTYGGAPVRVARALTGISPDDRLPPAARAAALRAAELLDLHGTSAAALPVALREERRVLDVRHMDEAQALLRLVVLARMGQLVGGVAPAVRRRCERILSEDPLPLARERVEVALYGLTAPAVAA
jgi:hypothetical protein